MVLQVMLVRHRAGEGLAWVIILWNFYYCLIFYVFENSTFVGLWNYIFGIGT